MNARLYTFNKVKKDIESWGCDLLSKNYKRANQALKIKCHCGKVFNRSYSNMRKGKHKSCEECIPKVPVNKPTYLEIASLFSKEGCRLISKTYKNEKEPLLYVATCGHKRKICFVNFKKGRGRSCRSCFSQLVYGLPIEEVKKRYKKYGLTLLDLNYKNNNTPMSCICKCGRKVKRRISLLHKINGCRGCMSRGKYEYKKIKNDIESWGCDLLSKNYKRANQALKIKCHCGKVFNRSYSNMRSSKHKSCQKCIDSLKSGSNCYMWNLDRTEVELNKRIGIKCSKLLRRSLEILNKKKEDKLSNILGYSRKQLKEHLLNHPNWKNASEDPEWQVDHYFPIKAFIEHGIIDIKLINCLENLRPLTKKENLSKQDSYREEDFINWCLTKGIKIS